MTIERQQQLVIVIAALVFMAIAMVSLGSLYAVTGGSAPQPGPAMHPLTSVARALA